MSESYTSAGEPTVPEQLAEKGLQGYDPVRAYAAVKDMYGLESTESADQFVEPLEALDADAYLGDEPLTLFDQDFNTLLDTYDSDAGVHADELANRFVQADTYEDSEQALGNFEVWAQRALDRVLGDTGIATETMMLSSDLYEGAIMFHSLRRLVQGKYEYLYDHGDSEPFKSREDGRNIDLAEE